MSKAMQLVGIILLGIFTLVIINLMNDVRSTNELDYYLLQETVEASMYDAIDYSYYRDTGLIKVDRDMFLESFNRRFAESVDSSNLREYKIKILDFNETPPKASVEVTTVTAASVKGEGISVVNRVDGIIETIYDDYVYSRGFYQLLVNPQQAYEIENVYPADIIDTTYDAVGDMKKTEPENVSKDYDASCSSGGVYHASGCADQGRSMPTEHVQSCTPYQNVDEWAGRGCWECDLISQEESCSCPNGGELDGKTCKKTEKSCPEGSKEINGECFIDTLACPDGGDLNKETKKCVRIRYSCPDGGDVYPGNVCRQIVYKCPEGTILKDGNVCASTYDPR